MRRGEEGSPYIDDAQQVPFLVEAFMQAARRPDWLVYLDTFIDHDRGYYPRHGLLDRRSHPRAGFRALSQLARLAEGASGQEQPWGWSLPAGQLWLSSLGCPPDAAQRSWRCLITGDSAEPGAAGVLWASA